MKFTDGLWLIQPGYKVEVPQQIYDVDVHENGVTLHCPYVAVHHRGNTLDGGLLTIDITSPMENAFAVKLTTHRGSRNKQAEFELDRGVFKPTVKVEGNEYEITSGDLSISFKKDFGFGLTYKYKGEYLTSSEGKSMARITDDEGNIYLREKLDLGVGENIYGLGERFGTFVKNGQSLDMWNADSGTDSDQTYINVPFHISSKNYGVFVNDTGRVSYEIGTETASKTQFSVKGKSMEYFLFAGDSPKDILNSYTDLTGKPAELPDWSYGLWLSTSFTTEYDEETVLSFIDGMLDRDIPISVFHFDCFWMKEYEWTNFLWNDEVFPDPEGLLKKIHDRGIKVCVWINPYIGQKGPAFQEAFENDYFVNTGDGNVWQWDRWQAGMGLVDFTNPEAKAWYKGKLAELIDMGVDSFKTDFGERIPIEDEFYGPEAVKHGIDWHDKSEAESMHNYYSYLYNQAVFEVLEEKLGKGQAVLFARSGTTGSQRYPLHWGGDNLSTYPSMAQTLRGGLSLGLSGFPYWSHDIGGFESGCTPDIYKRWTQFGLLSSHSRYHGNSEYKVPWIYGEEAVDVTRKYVKLKDNLMPYLLEKSAEATELGLPLMRAMFLEFPEDQTCVSLDRQYMFGDRLLVAPVMSPDGVVEFYLPEGDWVNVTTGEERSGQSWYKEKYDYMTMPLFVRAGDSLLGEIAFDQI